MKGLLRWMAPLLAVAGVAVLALWWIRGQRGPEAPRPVDLEALDPQVAELVTAAADAVDRRKGEAGPRVRLGMVYEANELYSLAVACYQQALAEYPKAAKVWFRLAIVREREGDLDGAIAALRESIRYDDGFAPSHSRLASWLLDAGGDLDEAEQAIDRARRLDSLDQEPRFVAVRYHLRERRPRRAIELIHDHGLTSGANAAYAYHLQVIAHRMLGELDAANAILPRARSAEPAFSDPWTREVGAFRTGAARQRSVAGALIQRGDFAEALPVLEELREQDPGDERVLNMLAQSYLRTGNAARALAVLEDAVVAAPDNFASHLNLVKVSLLTAGQGSVDFERLLGHADRALELRPDSGEAHLVRGTVLTALGRGEEAIDMYRQAWKLDARDPAPLLRAGGLLLQGGRWAEARQVFDAALAVHHGHPGALLGRARAEMELGDFDQAEKTLAELGEEAADQPVVASARARLEELRGGGK
jgi:tetratricopeptide (TPR) repeat protein